MAKSLQGLMGQVSDVDVRLLRVFRAVAEAGGVSAAELELNIGRSAISRHLKDLEIRLGVVLCRRGRGGFALTDEGRHIYDAALTMQAALDTFRSEVNDVHQRLTGNLSIGVFDKTATNPACKLADAIREFDGKAPEVSLDMHVGSINDIEKGVMDGRYNIGIIPTHRSSTSLDYQPLFPEQMYLYVGQRHPLFNVESDDLALGVLRHHKYVGLGYHSPNMEIGNQLAIKRDATGYDQEAVATLVLSGCYLGYLPDHYAQSFCAQNLMRPLKPEQYSYRCDFVAINLHAPKPSRVAETFLGCLRRAHQ